MLALVRIGSIASERRQQYSWTLQRDPIVDFGYQSYVTLAVWHIGQPGDRTCASCHGFTKRQGVFLFRTCLYHICTKYTPCQLGFSFTGDPHMASQDMGIRAEGLRRYWPAYVKSSYIRTLSRSYDTLERRVRDIAVMFV